MDDKSRALIIREDTFLKGEIRNGGRIEVFGYVEGEIAGDLLIVQPGGRCFGKVKVKTPTSAAPCRATSSCAN